MHHANRAVGRKRGLGILGVGLAFALISSIRPAHGENLVLESWVGGPSDQERQWFGGLREALTTAGAEDLLTLGAKHRLIVVPTEGP
jgi:hypothetical protein